MSSLALQAASAPVALIALMAVFGLTTMAAAVLAASAPAEHRASALSVYYLAAPVSMVLAAPFGLCLFRSVGAGANFTAVTLLGPFRPLQCGEVLVHFGQGSSRRFGSLEDGLAFGSRRLLPPGENR